MLKAPILNPFSQLYFFIRDLNAVAEVYSLSKERFHREIYLATVYSLLQKKRILLLFVRLMFSIV